MALKYIHSPHLVTKLDDILVIFEELAKERDIAIDLNSFSLYIENAAPKELKENLLNRIMEWKNGGTGMEVSKVFQTIKDEGKAEGKAEGKVEGIAEGIAKGRIEDARKMIIRGMDKELVHEITELPMEKIDQIEREIRLH